MKDQLSRKIEKKEIELRALLEITQAINSNLPEDSLYKIFLFTMRANLKILKLALFVFDVTWQVIILFGTTHKYDEISISESMKKLEKNQSLHSIADGCFPDFDYALPISHNGANIAFVLLGDMENMEKEHEKKETIKFIETLSNIMIVAIENKKLMRKQLEQESFRRELEIARDVQQFLFPKTLPCTEKLHIEASYLPHDHVGGDYYDYIPIAEDKFLICVADVSGKGIPAALLMSNFQASLHTLLRQTVDLKEIVEALNYQLKENTKGEKFITFFAAIYDLPRRTLRYVNAGHNPPIILAQKMCRLLEEGTAVLGILPELPLVKVGEIKNLSNFLLFAYTDGLTETINEQGEEFGEERVQQFIKTAKPDNLKKLHHDIIVSLHEFKGKRDYRDDITMLSCRIAS